MGERMNCKDKQVQISRLRNAVVRMLRTSDVGCGAMAMRREQEVYNRSEHVST